MLAGTLPMFSSRIVLLWRHWGAAMGRGHRPFLVGRVAASPGRGTLANFTPTSSPSFFHLISPHPVRAPRSSIPSYRSSHPTSSSARTAQLYTVISFTWACNPYLTSHSTSSAAFTTTYASHTWSGASAMTEDMPEDIGKHTNPRELLPPTNNRGSRCGRQAL